MRLGLSFLLLAVLGLSACDNNPHVPPLHRKRPDGAPWVVTYRAFPENPRSLDPQFAYDTVSHAVLSNIYDTFLSYDPLKAEYELVPLIGAELPKFEKHPDGTETVTCRIKPGLFFHDDPCFPGGKGREITSRDFIYSFQRMADPKVECPIASTMADYLSGFGTAYDRAEKSGAFDYDAPFPAVTALDKYTFQIHLAKEYPQIQYWLAFWFTAPVAREAVEYYDGRPHADGRHPLFRFHPVGTGAFKLAEWKRGQLIRLTRNDNYHVVRFPLGGWAQNLDSQLSPHAGNQLPIIDEVQLIIVSEAIPAWILFTQGWTDSSGISKDVFSSVINPQQGLSPEFAKRGVQLTKDIELSTWYMMFNMKDAFLGTHPKVRQAMSLVYNARAYNEIFGNNILHLTDQLLPPLMFGYEQDFQNPWRQTNLARARELMKEAGFPGGIDPRTGQPVGITLDTSAGSATERQMAEFERSQLEQLGIRVRIQENLFSQMLEKQLNGTYQLVFAGWTADYPDAENFFGLFYGPNITPKGSNQSRYQNPEFDRLFETMATMPDGPERAKIIAKMNELLLVKDCVIAPLFNTVSYALRQPWTPHFVKNDIVSQFGGLRYAVIDTALRKEKQQAWNRKNYLPIVVALLAITGIVAYGIRRRMKANV